MLQISLDDVKGYTYVRIDICCMSIGHCLFLVKDNDKWYICQSYINVYSLQTSEIDIDEFISDINIWKKWFSVDKKEEDTYIWISVL